MAAEVERQLEALRRPPASFTKALKRSSDEQPQLHAIATATGEDAPSFLERFKAAASKDICQDGGIVYQQWRKWKDVDPQTALKAIGGVLVAMGLASGVLPTVAVALVVYIVHLGVDAFCQGA